MPRKVDKLTPQQARFVSEYVVDLNAKQAAIRSGYSAKAAAAVASRLLTYAKVQAAIQERQHAREDRVQFSGDRVLKELTIIGDTDMGDYLTWGPDGVQLKSSFELTEEQRRAVAEVTETRRTIPQGKGPPIEEVQIRFKLHDKKGALDSLAKAHGLFANKDAAKHFDALLEVVLLVLRKYVAPERLERAINDLGTLVETETETRLPAVIT